VTGCWLVDLGSIPNSGKKFFFTPEPPERLWSSPRLGTGGFSQGLKRPGREAKYLSLYSADVKNGGAIPPLPHMFLWHDA
jgi:hypothetical protein